ncbi:hypothetical protein J6590_018443 [Homalodisca vitripennis]|nr:hypothetical protein J6590_018443 [Homalodisca vitripennis]
MLQHVRERDQGLFSDCLRQVIPLSTIHVRKQKRVYSWSARPPPSLEKGLLMERPSTPSLEKGLLMERPSTSIFRKGSNHGRLSTSIFRKGSTHGAPVHFHL